MKSNLMRSWKTTLLFGLSAMFGAIANSAPGQAGWASPLAEACMFAAGMFAKDSDVTGKP